MEVVTYHLTPLHVPYQHVFQSWYIRKFPIVEGVGGRAADQTKGLPMVLDSIFLDIIACTHLRWAMSEIALHHRRWRNKD